MWEGNGRQTQVCGRGAGASHSEIEAETSGVWCWDRTSLLPSVAAQVPTMTPIFFLCLIIGQNVVWS